MAKGKQVVFRADDDLSKWIEDTAKTLNRSQAQILCALVHRAAKGTITDVRAAIAEYVTRDLAVEPDEEKTDRPAKGRKRP